MKERLEKLIQRLHAQQSGAIALLLLAAILILFMCALVIYDAGQAAADKMDVQIGTDSAAFSHTVVKARGMNMISYANTIKRMIFSYLATYVNAWVAIIVKWLYYASRCFRWLPDLGACWKWAEALPLIITEGIELFTANFPSMGAPPFGGSDGRSRAELRALENYQQYMVAITPWWAYVEGAVRGMTNGALMTAAWPPPGSVLTEIKSAVAGYIGSFDGAFGTNIMASMPSVTTNVDALPIDRRDNDNTWSSVSDPYNFGSSSGAMLEYCQHYAFSLEAIVTGLQTYLMSDDEPDGWKTLFIPLQAFGSVGCFFAAWAYRNDYYVDYRIKSDFDSRSGQSNAGRRQKWLAATSSTHLGYIPHSGRNDDSKERQKYTYISQEAGLNDIVYGNEGYFALARSELVFKQPFEETAWANSFLNNWGSIGRGIAHRAGLHEEPDMWSPRWKSKNRPLILPGEQFGSAIQGSNAGLNTVINDTVPFLALGSLIGIVGPQGGDPPFSVGSAAHDFAYLLRLGTTFDSSKLQGLAK